MHVYLVHLRTSGETWHTAVCANPEAVSSVLRNYGITRRTGEYPAGPMNNEFETWESERDKSQTASVVKREVITR